MCKWVFVFSASILPMFAMASPLALFTMDTSSVAINRNAVLDASASYSTDPLRYLALLYWDLDGSDNFDDARGLKLSLSFAESGNIDIRLSATDDEGLPSSATYQALFLANVPVPAAVLLFGSTLFALGFIKRRTI
jgi:hypothetical protein